MTQQDNGSAFTRQEQIEAKGRLESARSAINSMIANKTLDDSLLSALQLIGDSLAFISGHSVVDTEDNERYHLIDAIGPVLAQRYAAYTTDLLHLIELVATESDELREFAELVEELLDGIVGLLREIFDEETPMNSDLWSGVQPQYVQATTLRNSFQLWRRTIQASTRAEDAADAAAESAGETSEHSLAVEFEGLRNSERAAANWFRGFTIALFVATIGFTAYIAFGESDGPALEVGQKLALGVPLLLLAAYLGREANQHRRTARWASVLIAQLKSVRAYSVELPEASRAELKLVFGRRVFLESPETAATSDDASAATPDVAAILREAANLARASRGVS